MKIPGTESPGLSGPGSSVFTPGKPQSPQVHTNSLINTSAVVNTAAARFGSEEVPHNSQTPAMPLSALLKTLGLPADRLSASIVSFAKFFSLPLEPGLLMRIRRQACLPGQANRELLSLAATAAADKGLELSEQALAEYAAAIDPDQDGGQGAERHGAEGHGAKRHHAEGREQNNEKRGDKETDKQPPSALSPPQLTELLRESAEHNPLLDILNRLPGKNGQRWLVFPFSFSEDGTDYRISLKILLSAEAAAGTCPAGRMSLDIVQSGRTRRRSLFVMDSAGDNQRLQAYLQPLGSPAVRLVRELSRRLALPQERVAVHDGFPGGDAPAVLASRDESLCPVNEAV